MTGRGRVSVAMAPLVMLIVLSTVTACSSAWRVGEHPLDDLDRAAIMRCRFEAANQPLTPAVVADLSGGFRLFMVGDRSPGVVASGDLALATPTETPDGLGAAPSLVGATTVDPSDLGAVVPGDATSTDPLAPGVGVYVFESDATGGWMAVLRLGAESNRRDRQRFDGAHTTLRIASIGDHSFGGTWTSSESSDEASGDFCAVRS